MFSRFRASSSLLATPSSSVPWSALCCSHRTVTRATHPLHLIRRHNERVAALAGAAENPKGLPANLKTKVCSCGCAHPATPLSIPSHGFSTSSSALAGSRLHVKREAFQPEKAAATPPEVHNPIEGELQKEIASFVGGRLIQSLQREQPPRGSGIQPLLDYNKQWSGEVARLNPEYFYDLAKQQSPQYLWIGCSDSRVPANEIVGLYPGDVFVHRNIANIVCNSDLNALAVLQYAIDCLKVEHVIISGHYKCGGVTAALNDDRIGLADHWILHVSAVKKRHWARMVSDLPTRVHLDALCELNVLAQVEHVVDTHLVRRVWSRQNSEDMAALREGRATRNRVEDEVEIHGWVYGLEDGIIRPLLTLNRHSNIEKELEEATDALFWRYSQL